ncbi:MAG: electron transfer flavoprotein subunit beta/FixA family protein [Planctomycetota bacterium]|jgi:electron transfer flavoprotein beta subunit
MNILVLLKVVPDVVEELEVAPDGKALDLEFLRLIVNESDEHALEEALLLKERHGSTVTAVALESPDIDDVLFTALAKGADRAVKVTDVDEGLTTWAAASLLAQVLPTVPDLLPADLVLTGCQANDDLDGLVAPILAHRLELPYLGIVTGVEWETESAGTCTAVKEYGGGVRGEFDVTVPALLGIQGAEKPPRYVPVAKVRAAMKSQEIETVKASVAAEASPVEVLRMTKPEVAERAEIIEGSPEEVAGKLCEILTARGVL